MSDEFQLRKDIDRFKKFLDDLERIYQTNGISSESLEELLSKYYDKSEVDIPLWKLDTDLTSLDTNLTTLLSNLHEFNEELISFDDNNTNLSTDLSKLKQNLHSFLDSLGLLDVDLTELSSRLTSLNVQLNGDSNNQGFVQYINELQTWIYGGTGYTINNPSSDSLKGTLASFSVQLGNIADGDNKLALTLSALTGYLTNFKGSLTELQTKIKTDYGESYYNSLDEEVIKLIASITSANKDLKEHKDLIDETNNIIGESNDTGSSTLYGKLNNTSSVASQASTVANGAVNTITNEVTPKINKITNETVPDLKNKIGYDNIPADTTLQGQITATDDKIGTVPNGKTLQGQITSHDNTIGGTTDTGEDNTLFGLINNTISDLDATNTNIGNVTQLSGTIVSNIKTTQRDIGEVQGDVSTINTQIGDVDVESAGNLQDRIKTIIELLNRSKNIIVVDNLSKRDSLNPNFSQIVYVKSENKYYTYEFKVEYYDANGNVVTPTEGTEVLTSDGTATEMGESLLWQ